MKRFLFIALGLLLMTAIAAGLAFASDPSPSKEPAASPYFEATLQQAVDELDGKANPASGQPEAPMATMHYTYDANLWPECRADGFTWNEILWPDCHLTYDVSMPNCGEPWPTKDFTWDAQLWPECGMTPITTDPALFWCDPRFTTEPGVIQCLPGYTHDNQMWPQCGPRYTDYPQIWPWCEDPSYTMAGALWPECQLGPTSDSYIWPRCTYTADPRVWDACGTLAYPTKDFTSDSNLWLECTPDYTTEPVVPQCVGYTTDPNRQQCIPYTMDPRVPECRYYTVSAAEWPWCHYTSDPIAWQQCADDWPTQDYTFDTTIWPECAGTPITHDPNGWWCTPTWTFSPVEWPGCDPGYTSVLAQWPQCNPGYTFDPRDFPECMEGLYTYNPGTIPCHFFTSDPRVWPGCQYTSDPAVPDCQEIDYPTKDYTSDPGLWPECQPGLPANYTADPGLWPECHYTSDPAAWPECREYTEVYDLGDAPDSTNHSGSNMTAYPAGAAVGTLAHYPTVYDPATGLPVGPRHLFPRLDAWLGPWVTAEQEADVLPGDEDGISNILPPANLPDQDMADDGLLYPVTLPHCTPRVISYTVTIAPGAPVVNRFVNVWFDWNRNGDWRDAYACAQPGDAPEWAVQNQVINLPPGTYVLQTPVFLAANPAPGAPMWMRISVADVPAPRDPTGAPPDGHGPDGGYLYGETEDYYLQWIQEGADLWIKDSPADSGAVPSPVPWWTSPDVWVRNDGDCTMPTHQDPVPGSPATVCIRVRNRMATPLTNIKVNAYWANAALGLIWPTSFSYLGSAHIASLPGFGTAVRAVPWNVPFLAGHFCLVARGEALQDPLPTGPDTLAPPDWPPNNNNIAQKNTDIVETGPEASCGFSSTAVDSDTVRFDAVNTFNYSVLADIEFAGPDFPASGSVVVDPGVLWGNWSSHPGFSAAADNTLHLIAGFPASIQGITLSPAQVAGLVMTITAEVDVRYVIEVRELINGVVVGGMHYPRLIPYCQYLPLIMRNG